MCPLGWQTVSIYIEVYLDSTELQGMLIVGTGPKRGPLLKRLLYGKTITTILSRCATTFYNNSMNRSTTHREIIAT